MKIQAVLALALVASTAACTAPESTATGDAEPRPVASSAPQPTAAPAAEGRANTADSLGAWEGTGVASDASGKELGGFTVALVRRSVGPQKTRTEGNVTLEGGRVVEFWQETEGGGARGYRLVSNNGQGGGRCFDNGLCQTYEERAGGQAFATTIVRDGDRMRLLVTELDKGQAVRFMHQTLTKKP